MLNLRPCRTRLHDPCASRFSVQLEDVILLHVEDGQEDDRIEKQHDEEQKDHLLTRRT